MITSNATNFTALGLVEKSFTEKVSFKIVIKSRLAIKFTVSGFLPS